MNQLNLALKIAQDIVFAKKKYTLHSIFYFTNLIKPDTIFENYLALFLILKIKVSIG